MLVGNAIVLYLMMNLEADKSQLPLYLVYQGLSGLFMSQAYSRNLSSDMIALANGDDRMKYLIGVTEKGLKQPFSFLCMVVIGIEMEKNLHSFLVAIFIMSSAMVFFHVSRKILEAREQQQMNEE